MIRKVGADPTAKPLPTARDNFDTILPHRLHAAKRELQNAPLLGQLRKEKESAGETGESFEEIWKHFSAKISPKRTLPLLGLHLSDNEQHATELRRAWNSRGQSGLDDRIRYAFYAHLTGSRFTSSDIKNQQTLADLRYPSEWFPATRCIHRKIHLHVGPTNSGKTYHALQRLEKAGTGVYAGPLRLLAHEVYTRMNAKGRPCGLITGEERRMPPGETHGYGDLFSCTVEMMPLNKSLDVAIIDEIQMIGSAERGWAWTQALLGVKAKEVHLCGEERTVPLIREICASVGEDLQIHRYERLSPLKMADASLEGSLRDLRKGDCIVSFSVIGIHALRRQIESATGRKVATVYGSLPPETRAQQARLFNDPNNEYDFLVASDAVGMGLNLAIKRIIFEHSSKFDGTTRRPLSVADVKQIAGRAGRYRIADEQNKQQDVASEDLAAAKGEPTPFTTPPPPPAASGDEDENLGLVTTLEAFDFPFIQTAMRSEPERLRTAGLFPPAPVLERFASYFPPSTPFSYILTRLHELSQMHSRFHLCGLRDQVWIADLIEPVTGLTIADRNVITSSPASKSDIDLWRNLMPAYARCIASQTGGELYNLPELPLETLEAEISANRDYLHALERLHKGIVTYLWLSYRFAGIFSTRGLAFHVKEMVEQKIEDVLGKFSFSEAQRRKLAERREKQLLRDLERGMERAVGEDGHAEEGVVEDGEREVGKEMGEGEVEREERLVKQTEVTFGGDRFSGEEEMAIEDPVDAEAVASEDEEEKSVSNFAQWRARETRGESAATKEWDLDSTISDAVDEGQEAAREASRSQVLMEPDGDERPSVAEEMPGEVVEQQSSSSAEATSLEQDHLQQPITPETELSTAPLETQSVPPPTPADPQKQSAEQSPPSQQQERPAGGGGPNQLGGGVPPKHLAHLEVDATELERDLTSRP